MPSVAEAGGAAPGRCDRWIRYADVAIVVALFLFHLASFNLSSLVNGPYEIFKQDSVHILDALAGDYPYPWNSQNHLLYHFLVETGYDGWKTVFGAGRESAYNYLKLFTALTGLLFFTVLRQVLCELGLATARRVVVLILTGVSVSVWFHFSAFETHCTALPALAGYLLALVRLRDRDRRTLWDRALFVGSLLVCGWSRLDLFRFAGCSAALPLVRGARRHWRSLVVDLVLVVVLGVAGTALIASIFYGVPLSRAGAVLLDRHDRPDLQKRLARVDNLAPAHLVDVGRAVAIYGILIPIEPRNPGRSFFAIPHYESKTGLYLQPARSLLSTALSSLVLAGVLAVLAAAAAASARRVLAGDPLHTMVAVNAVSGWLLYTWFNPYEPFLWVVEFVPLWIVAVADVWRNRPRGVWIALGVVTLLVAVHNYFAFYVPFR